MAELRISLTCADYARIMPLATGEVQPEGIALTMILGSRGSWPARAEMLRRAVQDSEVQGGEWSMAQYLYRIDKGDRRYVGLPVFPLRNFTARDLYVRRGGPIRQAADLAGQRIGMYSYTASGSIWYRHFLRFVGLDPAKIQWWIGDIDTPWSAPMDQTLPSGVKAPVPGRSLSDMLIAGELEAIYSPPRPHAYHPEAGPIARLFPHSATSRKSTFARPAPFPRSISSSSGARLGRRTGGSPGTSPRPSSPPTIALPRPRRGFRTPRRGWRPSSRRRWP
jgi:4,5-dihydroxyphthalate decarboxylase